MLHSNVAMFSSEQAERTMVTARISSDVSITMMGVEELISTFRRSSASVIIPLAFLPFAEPKPSTMKDRRFTKGTRFICLTGRELLPYNK